MATEMITFVVSGQVVSTDASMPPTGLTQGRIKHSVRVGTRRAGGGDVRVVAVPGEDIVVLHIANGPSLTLHPENARDLFLAQGESSPSRGAAVPGEVRVPIELRWRGLEGGVPTRGGSQGFLGDVLVAGVDVVTDLVIDVAADFAASAVVKAVDAQVGEGVYALRPDGLSSLKGTEVPLREVPAAGDGGPLLVLVHGTFSETHGTFGRLWTDHPQRVRALFTTYARRVYALDHQTLGASPIANAITLARALPREARLHLVTHSRGGLVAEVLARLCATPDADVVAPQFAGEEQAKDRENLSDLADLVKQKRFRVERVVRVACPARGTLLASKRLDAYVSVFKWMLELAGIPVVPVLVDFLGAVAKKRADPSMLPGLAAMIPDNPLVQWLHAATATVPGDLRVIAGDIQADSVVSWLKTLVADAYYWTDNDLVVQTRSMYGGVPRTSSASFVLERGGDVSHFRYFRNERSAEAIVNALTQDAPTGFRPIGPLSQEGRDTEGFRAARVADGGKPQSEKPAVFVLPGMLGSNLRVDGERIWLGWRLINGLSRLNYIEGQADGVEPDGPIAGFYDAIGEFLSQTHDVIEFAFDWRVPVEAEARRLADAVTDALTARETSSQPVRLVAHSHGAIVARTMQLERPEVWTRMMSRPGARVLMLGAPNDGSWAPMQVLSGDDTLGNAVVAVGAPFQDAQARALIARFPGLLQLQAGLLDAKFGLAQEKTWQTLADEDLQRMRDRSWWHNLGIQLETLRWGVPPQDVLDRAVALRQRLDRQGERDLAPGSNALVQVVGEASATPTGIAVDPKDGLIYEDVRDAGDGRVTWQSALLPGVRTWRADADHGNLPRTRAAFPAYLDLLQTGATSALPPLTTATLRGGTAAVVGADAALAVPIVVRSRPARTPAAARPLERDTDLLTASSASIEMPTSAGGAALQITVVNGDLTFVPQPLLLGHYRSLRLTGTERVINARIGGTMGTSLEKGLYPLAPGTHQIFINTQANTENPLQMPRPEAVIVVGLGEEGKLRSSDLVDTVRRGVIGWAQRQAERPGMTPQSFELAVTLLGSGGVGITVAQSAQLIAQGVREANDRLDDEAAWPYVSHLHVIELYLDRASDAWRALRLQAEAAPDRYRVSEMITSGTGGLLRPLVSGYRGADYDFITAITSDDPRNEGVISYTLDTRRARSEVRAQATQTGLLRELIAKASNASADPRIGRTLFTLLVPPEIEPFLASTTELLLDLNAGTAGIPWELLDTRDSRDSQPWAIRAKLLRRLRTPDFREETIDADADARVLVIGEPACDQTIYPRLPAARQEARAVVRRLTEPDGLSADLVGALISPDEPDTGPDASQIFNTFTEHDWRIIHIAGHGEPPKDDDPRGVVLTNGTFLGPREIRTMRVVPELVFVNCCYLAARDSAQLLEAGHLRLGQSYNRPQFAATVAGELIELGVRCVIAAGWAVADSPAMAFATAFYDAILHGRRFMDAVAEARQRARRLGGDTWAAYQCYGDPDWVFRTRTSDAQKPIDPPSEEFAEVSSPVGLKLALDTIAAKSLFQHAPADEQRDKIRHLEVRFDASWGSRGDVAEAFGAAWGAIGDLDPALGWYQRALAAEDALASNKAVEQLVNLRVRLAIKPVDEARARYDDADRRVRKASKGRKKDDPKGAPEARRERDAAKQALKEAAQAARVKVRGAIALLQKAIQVQTSMERESLLGSAYKRLAMIEEDAGKPRTETDAINKMKSHYERAEAIGRRHQLSDLFYPAMNRLVADLALHAGTPKWEGLDRTDLASIRQSLDAKVRTDPDFWSVAGQMELRMYEAIANHNLAENRADIEAGFTDLYDRVSAPLKWQSVRDQARFVLSKYRERTSASSEQTAVDQLLDHLALLKAAR